MNLIVNGEKKSVSAGMTLQMLLQQFDIEEQKVVVERNGEIYAQKDFAATTLHEDDKLEIVYFLGGG